MSAPVSNDDIIRKSSTEIAATMIAQIKAGKPHADDRTQHAMDAYSTYTLRCSAFNNPEWRAYGQKLQNFEHNGTDTWERIIHAASYLVDTTLEKPAKKQVIARFDAKTPAEKAQATKARNKAKAKAAKAAKAS